MNIVKEIGQCLFLSIVTDCLEHYEKEEKGGFEFGEGSGLGRIYKMVHRVE